jgi:two-component system, cell cycle response regulator
MDNRDYEPSDTRVVLIGSNRENMKKAGALLRNEGFDIALTDSGAKALELCAKETFDLALVETELPDIDPFSLPEKLRVGDGREELRVIFFIDSGDELAIVQAYHSKASDFIRVPYSAEEFLARVRIHAELRFSRQRFLEQFRELEEAYRRIDEYSRIDLLTGLPERGYFHARVHQEHSRIQRLAAGSGFCLVRVILANPPLRSGETGRGGLDYVLVALASTLRSLLREHDLVSRLSDSEFRMLLPDCGEEGGRSLSDRIQSAVAALDLTVDGEPYRAALALAVSGVTGDDPLPAWLEA